MWVSLAVLAVTYAFIIAGPFNHAIVALVAAAVIVIIGLLDQGEAITGSHPGQRAPGLSNR